MSPSNTIETLISNHVVWVAEAHSSSSLRTTSSLKDIFARGRVHEMFPSKMGRAGELHCPVALPIALAKEYIQSDEKDLIFIGSDVFPAPFFLRECFGRSAHDLQRFLYIDISSSCEKLWALEKSLSSTSVACVFVSLGALNHSQSRRVSLLSEQYGVTAFIFRPEKYHLEQSAAHSRWSITPALAPPNRSGWRVELIHTKGTKPLISSWKIDLEHEEEVSLHIFPELGSKPSTESALARYCA